MGYTSEGVSSMVKQQWKICHKFQGLIMQNLPRLTKFCTQQAWVGTRKPISTLARLEKGHVSLEASTHDLGSKQGLIFHLQAALSDLIISSILAPWYNGPEVGSLRDLEVVDFFVAWLASDQGPLFTTASRSAQSY